MFDAEWYAHYYDLLEDRGLTADKIANFSIAPMQGTPGRTKDCVSALLLHERTKTVSNESVIWIGNDHGGFELKLQIIDHLAERGTCVHDVGSASTDIVRYPLFAAQVAQAVQHGHANRGILICSTGIGMSIIANRYRGVRASLCTTAYMGKMTRAHNDSNVLCLGGKITAPADALEILDAWLDTPYEGGRHDISLGLIREAEDAISSCGLWEPLDYTPTGERKA